MGTSVVMAVVLVVHGTSRAKPCGHAAHGLTRSMILLIKDLINHIEYEMIVLIMGACLPPATS
jgi:hypothetical protein